MSPKLVMCEASMSRRSPGALIRTVCCRLALGVPLLLAMTSAGCGGGGGGGSTAPNAVVARVGRDVITKAMFSHAFTVAAREEAPASAIPVPPSFSGCIAYMKASDAKSASSGSKPPSAETLKTECSGRYHGLKSHALDQLIIDDWMIEAAPEEGVSVSEQAVQEQLKKEEGKDPAQFKQMLAASGRTLADQALSIRVQLLGEGIRHAIREKSGRLSDAQVLAYYDAHKETFGVPARRDLEIARTGSEAEAQRVKQEIASGKSFASVVKRLPLQQPVYSHDGLVMGYESGMYNETPLNDAIFAAKLDVLNGPMTVTNLGEYIFEVTRAYPARPESLPQAEATIRQKLPAERYEHELAVFISDWRARWTAKTDCQPGYVVPKCSQFKPSAGSPPEASDPFTFD